MAGILNKTTAQINVVLDNSDVLEQIDYVTAEGKILMKKPLQVPINDLAIGGQHKVSSGGDNLFTKNVTQDINYYGIVAGLKNQFEPANFDSTGVIHGFERSFSDIRTVDIDNPEKVPFTYIPYDFVGFTVGSDRASFGVTVRTGIALNIGDYINFTISRSGIEIFNQNAKLTSALSVGDVFVFEYGQPVVFKTGDVINAKLEYSTDSGETYSTLTVSESTTLTIPYDEVVRREFLDIPLSLEPRFVDSNTTGDDLVIKPNEKILINALTSPITLTLHPQTKSFTIRDANENLSISDTVTVDLDGVSSILMNTKNEFYIVDKAGSTWTYYNVKTGNGGLA